MIKHSDKNNVISLFSLNEDKWKERKIQISNPIVCIGFSQDSKELYVVTTNTIEVVRLSNYHQNSIRISEDRIIDASIHEDDLIICSSHCMTRFCLSNKKALLCRVTKEQIYSCNYRKQGDYFVSIYKNADDSREIVVLNSKDLKPVLRLKDDSKYKKAVFDPKGEYIVANTFNEHVFIYNFKNFKETSTDLDQAVADRKLTDEEKERFYLS